MQGKTVKRPVHGWVVIDKPAGRTSAAVVSAVRRVLNAAKAGHGGTLDPLATGVLPIAIGEATKTMPYIVEGTKIYRFTIRWGERRTTDDAEGDLVETCEHRPDLGAISAALRAFEGEIEQIPPTYSAIKVAGHRAYALARAEKPFALLPRKVFIERIALIEALDADHAVFEVRARKGVYMRSIARDLAMALGTLGHVSALRRLAVGPFTEGDAMTLDRFGGAIDEQDERVLMPVDAALVDLPTLTLTEAEARQIQHGRPVAVLPVATRSSLCDVASNAIICAIARGKLVALAQIKGAEIRPVRILNL